MVSFRMPSASALADQGRLIRGVALHTAITFAATLAIQIATFAILALAALVMPTGAFARLSLIVAAVMLASTLFELGLNITSTKMYGDTGDEGYLRSALAVRVACIPIGALLGLAVWLGAGAADAGLGIALGAVLNLWNGMRATDQARQDYRSFTRASIAFALLRAVAGLVTLYLTGDPVKIALATYALPVVATVASKSAVMVAEAALGPTRQAWDMLWYATHVYINAVTFIVIPYLPQFVISHRLDATAVGTYGLILTFTGPVSLLVYSLRSVLLPKMLGPGRELEDWMWSSRGLAVIGAGWLLLMIGGAILSYGLAVFYGHKFPGIGPAFLIFFVGFSATAMIGLYSLSVHTQGVPQLSNAIGLAKLVALAVLLFTFSWSLYATIAATSAVMFVGELALAGALASLRRTNTV